MRHTHTDNMTVALVPFEMVRRVGTATRRIECASIGFAQIQPPAIIAPESLLRAALAAHPNSVG